MRWSNYCQTKNLEGKLVELYFSIQPITIFLRSITILGRGAQEFAPDKPVVSDLLTGIQGNAIVDVVHLTLQNYGAGGYLDDKFEGRGINNLAGSPRLNTTMVKGFINKTPRNNRGQYLEVGNIPHAILRDGNIDQNIQKVLNIVSTLLR